MAKSFAGSLHDFYIFIVGRLLMSLKMMANKFREDKTYICKQMIDTGYEIKMLSFPNHDTQSRSLLVMQRPRQIDKRRSLPNLWAFTNLGNTSS